MITTLKLTSPFTNPATPFTVGHWFRKGDVPVGQMVTADISEFQCVPKTYWKDGSLRVGILSGKVSTVANVATVITLSKTPYVAATPLTIADLKAANPTMTIGMTNAKDWTFDTAPQIVGDSLKMSGLLDILDAGQSYISVDNGAVISNFTAVQNPGTDSVVVTASLSGGTEGGYQTVRYRLKYKAKRNITAITPGAVTRITCSPGWKTIANVETDSLGARIMGIGNTVTLDGITGMTELNGLTGTVTNIGSSATNPTRSWFEVSIDSTGFSAYTGGGTAAKNELNTAGGEDIAYVRTGGGLEWNGTTTTYKASNSTGQTGVTWTGADWDTPFEQLESGPQMSSWKYRKALGPDPHMVAWLEVRLYKGAPIQVMPKVENGFLLVERPGSRIADYTFVLNGVEKFNRTQEIKAHSQTVLIFGTHLDYWTITDPQVYPSHDAQYAYSTRMMPKAMHVTPANTSRLIGEAYTSFYPMQRGNWQQAMGSAGFQADIGIIPNHDALYLSCDNPKAYAGMMRNAYSCGRYRMHYRDEETNRPPKFSKFPNLVINGVGSGVGGVGTSSTNHFTPIAVGGTAPGCQYISSHAPAMCYLPYLASGWDFLRETMEFHLTMLFYRQVDSKRGYTLGIFQPDAGANQTRGAAWAFRTLIQVLVTMPSSHPLYNEILTMYVENIKYVHHKYMRPGQNPFGFTEPYTDYGISLGQGLRASGFQCDFMTAAFGHIMSLEPDVPDLIHTQLVEFFHWKAQSAIGRLGGTAPDEFLYRDCGQYTIPMGPNQLTSTNFYDPDDPDKPLGPWWKDWGEIWDKIFPEGHAYRPRTEGNLRDGQFGTPGSYQANLLIAIVPCVEHGVPGATAAYNRLITAPNWQIQSDALISYPVYGVQPAFYSEPEVVVPTTPRGRKVRIAKTNLIPGKCIIGFRGFGVLAEDIPEIGTDGPGLGYPNLSFPADAGKEIRIEVVSRPPGELKVDADYGATYSGPTGVLTFNICEENKLVGLNTYMLNMDGGGPIESDSPYIFKVTPSLISAASGTVKMLAQRKFSIASWNYAIRWEDLNFGTTNYVSPVVLINGVVQTIPSSLVGYGLTPLVWMGGLDFKQRAGTEGVPVVFRSDGNLRLMQPGETLKI